MGANNKKINMVGAQFGEWTVLEQYDCGNLRFEWYKE